MIKNNYKRQEGGGPKHNNDRFPQQRDYHVAFSLQYAFPFKTILTFLRKEKLSKIYSTDLRLSYCSQKSFECKSYQNNFLLLWLWTKYLLAHVIHDLWLIVLLAAFLKHTATSKCLNHQKSKSLDFKYSYIKNILEFKTTAVNALVKFAKICNNNCLFYVMNRWSGIVFHPACWDFSKYFYKYLRENRGSLERPGEVGGEESFFAAAFFDSAKPALLLFFRIIIFDHLYDVADFEADFIHVLTCVLVGCTHTV